MKFIKLFLASLALGLSLTSVGFVTKTASTVQAHSGHTASKCLSLVGGPNSAYTGELEWDFAVGVNFGDAKRSSMKYRYIATDTGTNKTVFDNTDSTSSRRIKFPKAGSYKVVVTVIESSDHQSTCSMSVKIGNPAVCTGIEGGPNSARKGELEWDFALNIKRNDSKTSELKYRYQVLDGTKQVYDNTGTSVSRRIKFPKAGTYTVIGSVVAGNYKSECRRNVTIEAASNSSSNSGNSSSSSRSSSATPSTATPSTPAPVTPAAPAAPITKPTPAPSAAPQPTATPKPTGTATPKALPNTGPADVFTAFGATSAIGYAVSMLRRRFF